MKTTVESLVENYHTLSRRDDIAIERVRRTVFAFFRRTILPQIPQTRTAVVRDVGCGEGALLLFLRESGYQNISGIDLSPENVVICRRLGLPAEQGNVLETNVWPAAAYDVVLAIDLIEHLPKSDAGPFLTMARRSLKPGGILILQTPNMGSVLSSVIRYGDLSHEFGLTERSAVSLLMIAGFRPMDIQVLPSWNATTSLGRLREMYLSGLHFFWSAADDSSRTRVPTKNLIILGRLPRLQEPSAPHAGQACHL